MILSIYSHAFLLSVFFYFKWVYYSHSLPFFNKVAFFPDWYLNIIYKLQIQVLNQIYVLNIFHSLICLFILLTVLFCLLQSTDLKKKFNKTQVNFFFPSVDYALGIEPKTHYQTQGHLDFLLCVFLKVLEVCILHFEIWFILS